MKTNKLDARKLSSAEQALLREMIVRQHIKGKSPNEIMELLDVKAGLVYTTIRNYKRGGWEAIGLKVMGRPTKSTKILTPEQEKKVQETILNTTPSDHKLSGFLWDMRNLIAVIAILFSINIKRSTLAVYTDRWGYTPQRPIVYNRKQNPKEVQEWLEVTYPNIKKRAKKENAEIFWCDETGIQNQCNYQVGYAPKGQTPVAKLSPNHKIRVNMISAITNQGKLKFMTYEGKMNQQLFIVFLKRLIKSSKRKIFLIVDNLSVHHGKQILKPWLEEHKNEIEIFYLPSYSPELNPNEYFNGTLKRRLERNGDSSNLMEFKGNVHNTATKIQRTPQIITNLYKEVKISYAAE
jgi:transposase